MLLEVLLGRGDELDGSELEAAVLEARNDGADEAALRTVSNGARELSCGNAPERHQA